jgi:hypothetical protein
LIHPRKSGINIPDMPLPDFNPQGLLPEGVHLATVGDLQERFVTPFPASATRQKVFANFCRYQTAVTALGVQATQWVDGSFVDQSRLAPEDVDAVNFCDFSNLNALPTASRSQITPLLDGRESTKTAYDTHTFREIRFPAAHPLAANSENRRKYWRDWFSRPQDYSGPKKVEALWRGRKGIVQMNVGDASLCPTVSDAL